MALPWCDPGRGASVPRAGASLPRLRSHTIVSSPHRFRRVAGDVDVLGGLPRFASRGAVDVEVHVPWRASRHTARSPSISAPCVAVNTGEGGAGSTPF